MKQHHRHPDLGVYCLKGRRPRAGLSSRSSKHHRCNINVFICSPQKNYPTSLRWKKNNWSHHFSFSPTDPEHHTRVNIMKRLVCNELHWIIQYEYMNTLRYNAYSIRQCPPPRCLGSGLLHSSLTFGSNYISHGTDWIRLWKKKTLQDDEHLLSLSELAPSFFPSDCSTVCQDNKPSVWSRCSSHHIVAWESLTEIRVNSSLWEESREREPRVGESV